MKNFDSNRFEVAILNNGLPILYTKDADDISTFNNHEILIRCIGSPFSPTYFEKMSQIQKWYLKWLFSGLFQDGELLFAVTSCDLTFRGKRRLTSAGHMNGEAIDFSVFINSPSRNVVDLYNNLSFIVFLNRKFHALMKFFTITGNQYPFNKPLLIGIEYNHVHMELPWSSRTVSEHPFALQFRDPAPGVKIGIFNNPPTVYGINLPESSSRKASFGVESVFMLT